MPMLAALAQVAQEFGVDYLACIEARMACGLGVCLSCSLPRLDGTNIKVCRDGPLIDGLSLNWDIILAKDKKTLPPRPSETIETVTKTSTKVEILKTAEALAAEEQIDRKCPDPDLSVNIGPLKLKNPIIAASGTFGYGLELASFCPPQALGAVISKGLSLTPWRGNPSPRIVESAGGLINAIGLENMGIDSFLEKALGQVKATGAIVGANVLGRRPEDYTILCQKLSQSEIDFIELNVSCPNLKHPGGLSFGADPELLAKIVTNSVKAAESKPVIVKLPPLVTDITLLAKITQDSGAAAVSLINSLPALSIDLTSRKPNLANGTGGLTGPPIKPLALRQVMLCSRAVTIPIIGLGGIMNHLDALEFIIAGASAVQLGTGLLVDPSLPMTVIKNISEWLKHNNYENISQIKGSLVL
jgi:dihydroorotate dehydrogenase (NAD+) catalytic subunit